MTWRDIVDVLTLVALVVAIIQIKISRKQLFLATIKKCVSDFRALEGLNESSTDERIIVKYLDLVSEELFYFRESYIPHRVAVEWVDGMLDLLPIVNERLELLNKDHCIEELAKRRSQLYQRFPRVANAFRVSGSYNWNIIYSSAESDLGRRVKERNRLILEIMRRNKRFTYFNSKA